MAFLQAKKLIRSMATAQVILRVQGLVLIVWATWVWGFGGFVVSTVITFAVGLWPLWKQVGVRRLLAATSTLPSGFMNMSLFAMLSALAVKLGMYGDVLILDHFATARADIGFYSLAAILVQGAWLVVHSAGVVSVPYFSERSHDTVWFRRKLIETQARASALSVVVGLAVYGAAWVFIPLVYGPAYKAVLPFLAVLLLKNVFVASYTIVRMALLAMGRMNYNFVAFAITTPAGLVLSYVLLVRYGIIGVAWAQGIAAVFTLLLLFGLAAYALRPGQQLPEPAPDSPAQSE